MSKWQDAASVVGVDTNKFVNNGFILQDIYHIDETLGATGESKGIATVIMDYERAVNGAAEVYANRFNFKAAAMDLQSYSAINRGSYWSGKTYLNLEFKWASAAAMNQYFMTGGYLKLSPTFTPVVVDITTAIWANLIAQIGSGIYVKACGTIDGNNNADFSKYLSFFEIPVVAVGTPWLNTAPPGSVGSVLYIANEKLTSSMGGYGGYSGIITDSGTDTISGWADIIVEARILTDGTLQFHLTFDNETSDAGVPTQVKGNLGCNFASHCSSNNWGTIVPVNTAVHPSIVSANSYFI
jgi:hypothetical protein